MSDPFTPLIPLLKLFESVPYPNVHFLTLTVHTKKYTSVQFVTQNTAKRPRLRHFVPESIPSEARYSEPFA